MNRIIEFFKAGSFAILLFYAGVLLFNWPLLSMAAESGESSIFSYLLISWTVIVVLLIAVGQSIRHGEKTKKED